MAGSAPRTDLRRHLRFCHDELMRQYEQAYMRWRREQLVLGAIQDDVSAARAGDDQPLLAELASCSAAEAALRVRLDQISAALRRWDSGTYGHCHRCGHPIPAMRLLAYPLATHCADCEHDAGST